MGKTDKEVLELCKAWFEDIMERCDRLTSGNVSHGSRAIRGVAKNYAEFVDEHLHNRWKPSDEQILALDEVYKTHGANNVCRRILFNLMNDLKKLREE